MSELAKSYEKAFKRVNFFRGFLTTEEDWNDATEYHLSKHRLHNRLFHGRGIVPGHGGELRVQARGKGELSVEILPGLAIDGQGREVHVSDPEIRAINPLDYKLPQTVYICAKPYEELTDFIAYKENLEYKGHRRRAEVTKIEVHVIEPDPADAVELARVHLEPGVRRITDARDPSAPKANEIDLRFRSMSGVVGTHLSAAHVLGLTEVVAEMRRIYGFVCHRSNVTTAGSVEHAAASLLMMLRTHLVDSWNLFQIMADVLEMQWAFVEHVEEDRPDASTTREFGSFKRHVELLRDLATSGRRDADTVQTLINYEEKCNENLRLIFFKDVGPRVAEAAPVTPLAKVAEELKTFSGSFDATMEVDGATIARRDHINPLNKKSEEAHDFRIVEPRDRYRSRQKLKYPDGTVVEDVGVAYEGGRCDFTIKELVPGKPVLMLVRMDYVHGDWEAEMHVNDKRVGVMRCAGSDRKFRWRNWPFIIEAEHVKDVELRISQVPLTEARDINFFHIWIYQSEDE